MNVRHVTHPDPIGSHLFELPLEKILRRRFPALRLPHFPKPQHSFCFDARSLPQAGHSIAATRLPLAEQLAPGLDQACPLFVFFVHLFDTGQQGQIASTANAHRPFGSGITGASAHA